MKGSELFPACEIYLYPDRQHTRVGGCAFKTNHKKVLAEGRGFVDPLKASKRKAKGK
jgi:hypothetical protein